MMTPLRESLPSPYSPLQLTISPLFPQGRMKPAAWRQAWPDGKMASRNVASSEMNSVLEIPYRDDRPQDPGSLEVMSVWTLEPNKQAPPTTLRAGSGDPRNCRLCF